MYLIMVKKIEEESRARVQHVNTAVRYDNFTWDDDASKVLYNFMNKKWSHTSLDANFLGHSLRNWTFELIIFLSLIEDGENQTSNIEVDSIYFMQDEVILGLTIKLITEHCVNINTNVFIFTSFLF